MFVFPSLAMLLLGQTASTVTSRAPDKPVLQVGIFHLGRMGNRRLPPTKPHLRPNHFSTLPAA